MSKVEITTGSIEDVVALTELLPEFKDPYGPEAYRKRFQEKPHLISIANIKDRTVGFKVAYERKGYCYSWLGGVLPDCRGQGIASALADAQETWAKEQGYPTITMKTRNRHRNMLHMALKRGFNIIGFEARAEENEHRIWLRKSLTPKAA